MGTTNSEAGPQEERARASAATRNPVLRGMGISGSILESMVLGTTDEIPLEPLHQLCRENSLRTRNAR